MTPVKIDVKIDEKGNAEIELDEAALRRIPLRDLMTELSTSEKRRPVVGPRESEVLKPER